MTDQSIEPPVFALPGSQPHSRHVRLCNWCEKLKPVASGVEMGPGLWKCGTCWIRQGVHSKV